MQSSFSDMYGGRPTFRGVVYKKTIGNYTVHNHDRVVVCELSNRIRKQLIYPTADPGSLHHRVQKVVELEHMDPLAVGDEVRYINAENDKGLIIELLPRRNKLTRRSAVPKPLHHGAHPFEQIIVTNVDQVVPVIAAAQPTPKWNLLDRYLASAESLGLASLVCITKVDLAGKDRGLDAELEIYRSAGYPVVLTSSLTGEGMEALIAFLQGRVSVMVGKSGVGKTSLLNGLQRGLGLRVKQISRATGKGRHTTSNLEMYPLDIGGFIVDTPGMREFGLWDVEESDLALLFPEMRPLVGSCRFGLDCTHHGEPGCAIRRAAEGGEISLRRYQSYLRIDED